MTKKFDLYGTFGSNENAEVEGKWVYPAGEGKGMPAFKLARAGGANSAFTSMQQKELLPYQRLIQSQSKAKNGLSVETQRLMQDVLKKCFVATCLLDWKNVPDRNKEPLPFTKENAAKLMDDLPALYEELVGYSNALSTYQDEDTEAEAGN